MGLNNTSLSAVAIAELYKNVLIDNNSFSKEKVEPEAKKTLIEPDDAPIKFLGANNKNILVLVNTAEAVYLPDEELKLLTDMLTACKFSLADVAIVNISTQPLHYQKLTAAFHPNTALLFDVLPNSIDLPINFPAFQIQKFAGSSFLYCPSLKELQTNIADKKQLWNCLKKYFQSNFKFLHLIIDHKNCRLMKLIFATNNQHKVTEIQTLLNNEFELLTLKDAGILIDIPEPHNTLEMNATEKSRTIFSLTGLSCFSEDTGLEVAALNGEPGVKSARYAGEEKSFDKNIDKLLANLVEKQNRSAQFRTVISLIINGIESQFEAVCEGTIIAEKKGNQGFGYDPVFIPNGSHLTFAEMPMNEKAMFSHRAKAVAKLIVFLNSLQKNN